MRAAHFLVDNVQGNRKSGLRGHGEVVVDIKLGYSACLLVGSGATVSAQKLVGHNRNLTKPFSRPYPVVRKMAHVLNMASY